MDFLDDLDFLLSADQDAKTLREEVSPDDLMEKGVFAFSKIIDICDKELERLQVLALKIADIIWDDIEEHREKGDKVRLGLRVRIVGGSLQIVWYADPTSRAGIKGKITAKHIKKGGRKKYRYNESSFSRFSDWERENAMMAEEYFEKIRQRANSVNNVRAWAKKYLKNLEQES